MAGERYSPLLLFLFEVREKLLAIEMGGIAQKGFSYWFSAEYGLF